MSQIQNLAPNLQSVSHGMPKPSIEPLYNFTMYFNIGVQTISELYNSVIIFFLSTPFKIRILNQLYSHCILLHFTNHPVHLRLVSFISIFCIFGGNVGPH